MLNICFFFHHLYHHLLFIFFQVFFKILFPLGDAYWEQAGCRAPVVFNLMISGRSQLLFESSLLFSSLVLFTHDNEMDVSHFLFSQLIFFLKIFSHSWRGRIQSVKSGLSGSSLPQRHYCLGERTSVAFQKSRV